MQFSICLTSILRFLKSTSTKLGINSNCSIGAIVVAKVKHGVIISDDFSISKDERASKFAEEPEFTKTPYFLPNILDISFSNCIVLLPDTKDLLSDFKTSITALI